MLRGTWEQPPFDFKGRFFEVEGALVKGGITPQPDIYFGGSSGPAGPVAAKHADVYLTWGEPPELVTEKLDWMRSLAKEQGRTLRFGLRVHTISRDTSEDAWRHAQWLLDGLDPERVAAAQAALRNSESTGQARMLALRDGRTTYKDARELEVSPGLWSGVGLVRGGAGTALVGSHDEVADKLAEYHALGIDEFILSGYPHVEEAWWFGEGVMPRLRDRGLLGGGSARTPPNGWRRRPDPAPPAASDGAHYAGHMDEAAWGALTLSLTVLGGIYTWFAFRSRGFVAGLRGVGFTIIPVALLLTDTLEMATKIGSAVGDWVGDFAFSPASWLGIILAVVSVTCFVAAGFLAERGVGAAPASR